MSDLTLEWLAQVVGIVRIRDRGCRWRIVYRLDVDAVVIVEVFVKTTRATPKAVIEACRDRLRRYDEIFTEGP